MSDKMNDFHCPKCLSMVSIFLTDITEIKCPKCDCIMKKGMFPSYKNSSDWISLKDKKPPKDIWIIGGNKFRVEFGVWMDNKIGFSLPQCNYLCLEITHWMPMPEPPNE